MLGLILFATAGIAWLCWRSRQLQPMAESSAVAIRAGLWFLLLSCGLGFLVTILGAVNVANGRPPELWGPAGVLKYPHGVVLHAIQTLPLLSLLMEKLRVSHAAQLVRAEVASHAHFLIHALWQTVAGRTRFDIDTVGGVTLVAARLLLLFQRCRVDGLGRMVRPSDRANPLTPSTHAAKNVEETSPRSVENFGWGGFP
jgi:hypothetical protein